MRKLFLLIKTNIKLNFKKYIFLIISFALASMCIITSIDFKKNTYNAVWETLEKTTCGIHLNVSNKDTEQKIFDYEKVMTALDNNEEVEDFSILFSAATSFNNSKQNLYGMYQDDFEQLGVNILEVSNYEYNNGVFISKSFSKLYSLSVDDEIILSREETDFTFKIKGIVNDCLFINQNGNPVICDINYLNELFEFQNKATCIFVRATSLESIDRVYNDLTNVLSEYDMKIVKTFNPSSYTFYLEPISVAIRIFSIFALLTSSFLCFFVYKSMMLSRVKNIAVQKSIGVSEKELFSSSFVEGVILVFVSTIIGIIMAFIINFMLSSSFIGVSSTKLSFKSCTISFGILLVMCLSSIILTHKYIIKSSVIELIKGKNITHLKSRKINKIIMAILGLLFMILFVIFRNNSNQLSDILALIFGVILIMIVSYYIIKLLVCILSKSNLKNRWIFQQCHIYMKSHCSIIIMCVLIISLISMISTVSNTLNRALNSYYKDIDILIITPYDNMLEDTLETSDKEYNIESYYKSLLVTQNVDDYTIYIQGINPQNYEKYSQDTIIAEDSLSTLEKLDAIDQSIIISTTLANKLDVELNDEIELLTLNGMKKFTIIALTNSFENGGNNILISQKKFDDYFSYQSVYYYLELNDNGSMNDLVEYYNDNKSNYSMSVYDMRDLITENNNSITQIFITVYFLIMVLSLTASINIILNISMTIKARSKMYATQWTVGMSKKESIFSILLEYGLIIGITSIVTLCITAGLNYIIFEILNSTVGYFVYNYSISIIGALSILMIYIISLIKPLYDFRNINMITWVKGGEE